MSTLLRVLTVLLTLGALMGCSGSTEQEVVPSRQGERGETCRAANDCAGSLACINSVCTQNDFPIDIAGGECVLIQCEVDSECWEQRITDDECASLLQNCDEFGDGFACQQYVQNCIPNAECTDNLCFTYQACRAETDCPGTACIDGRCDASCTTDRECAGGLVCASGECVPGCTESSECPYFHTCQNRQCVETGCTTDRECAAFTDSPNATCTEGECQIPCVSDAECNAGEGGNYSFYGCQSGLCVYLGCETDEECRIELGVAPGSEFRAICQEGAGN